MLLPGPEAQQLAIYIGWLMHRTLGGLIAGLLFILPGALVMLGLSMLYVLYRQVPLVDGPFFGVKAAVLAVVIEAGSAHQPAGAEEPGDGRRRGRGLRRASSCSSCRFR